MKRLRLLLPVAVAAVAGLVALTLLQVIQPAAAQAPQDWGDGWYWKDGGWLDYAPNGVPDFDQKQDPTWQQPPASGFWSHCGPVAAANSIWWFDSKFEPTPVPPPVVNDNYWLVTPYLVGGLDDHAPNNVVPFVNNLACYFSTNGMLSGIPIRGTEVHSMSVGLQRYLYNKPTHPCAPVSRSSAGSYYDDYHVQLVKMPTFDWVTAEISRSEDVILLLGFWQFDPFSGGWFRPGGHYVTVAGIKPGSNPPQIAFSDPVTDAAEYGGPGYVYSGSLIVHPPIPGHGPPIHNDAGNVSHDIYSVTLTAISPGGVWEIEGYPYDPSLAEMNYPDEFLSFQRDYDPALPVVVEVEYALAMSPFYWKAGGEWVYQYWNDAWMWEWWWYEDDGDSCLPDFSFDANGDSGMMSGAVAAANSLWWFDSKAETLVTGGFPVPPPAVSDHYELVMTYAPGTDDHVIANTALLIDDLHQNYLHSNVNGATSTSMTVGINQYLLAHNAVTDFYTKTQASPDWEWIADEVETSEDVILLLGFYEQVEGVWERKGGHWVNAAGVNRTYPQLGLSDPLVDNAMGTSITESLRLGRVFPPERQGIPFTSMEKNSPQDISHDIYRVANGTAMGSALGLVDYPVKTVLPYVIGFNGGGTTVVNTQNPMEVVVEWAIGVSPYSDLVITKTLAVTQVVAGDPVTYTLEYANYGLAAAHAVTITDLLPVGALTDLGYTAWPPVVHTPGYTYVWTLPKLTYGQHGVITIIGRSLVTATLGNMATITGQTSLGDPTPDGAPGNNSDGLDIHQEIYLPLMLKVE